MIEICALLLPEKEDCEAPILSPAIIGDPYELTAPFSFPGDISVIDFRAGEDEDNRVRHIAVPQSCVEIENTLRDAQVLKRRIYFMVGRVIPGITHSGTGESVLFGRLCVMRKF